MYLSACPLARRLLRRSLRPERSLNERVQHIPRHAVLSSFLPLSPIPIPNVSNENMQVATDDPSQDALPGIPPPQTRTTFIRPPPLEPFHRLHPFRRLRLSPPRIRVPKLKRHRRGRRARRQLVLQRRRVRRGSPFVRVRRRRARRSVGPLDMEEVSRVDGRVEA